MNKVLLLLSLMILGGCVVTEKEINSAIGLCKDHNSIKYIYTSGPALVHVQCNDNIEIYKNLEDDK